MTPFKGWGCGLVRRGLESTGCARSAISGIVHMVHLRTCRLNVGSRVRAEMPFHQRSKGKQQLRGNGETNRRPPEYRWKNA
ncbi:MAG: hypothetical protein ABR585_03295 [Gemmatimonadaceae bacterium]